MAARVHTDTQTDGQTDRLTHFKVPLFSSKVGNYYTDMTHVNFRVKYNIPVLSLLTSGLSGKSSFELSLKLLFLLRGGLFFGDRFVLSLVMAWSCAEEEGRLLISPFTSSRKDFAFFSIFEPEAFSLENKTKNYF